MFNSFKTIAQANAAHATAHPAAHTALAIVYGVGVVLLVGANARKMGEKKLKTMKSNFSKQWD